MQNLQVHFSYLLLQTKLTKQVLDGCEPLDRILPKPDATWLATPFETLKEDQVQPRLFELFNPILWWATALSPFSLSHVSIFSCI